MTEVIYLKVSEKTVQILLLRNADTHPGILADEDIQHMDSALYPETDSCVRSITFSSTGTETQTLQK